MIISLAIKENCCISFRLNSKYLYPVIFTCAKYVVIFTLLITNCRAFLLD